MKYSIKQQEAIDSNDPNIIVISPAGSGKTTCLVGALERYMSKNPKDSVVAITFTKKAAEELKQKIVGDAEVSTIHSWAYRRLKELAEKHCFRVRVLEDEQIKDILDKICVTLKIFYINKFQLFFYVMGNYNIDIDEKLKRRFERVKDSYIEYKRKNDLYDFTDLPLYLYNKMEDYGEVIDNIDALFVDEFQDIDDCQSKIFELVLSKKKFYIGDPAQSIYLFRGSVDIDTENYPSFKIYKLKENYRSYQEIVDFADTCRQWADYQLGNVRTDSYEFGMCPDDIIQFSLSDCFTSLKFYRPSDIDCIRGKGGSVYSCDDMNFIKNIVSGETYNPATVIQSLLQDKDTYILCRSNKQVKKLQALGIKNVSTVHQAKGLEYENVILTSFEIKSTEEKNIAYVGMTRAKNKLMVINYTVFYRILCDEDIVDLRKIHTDKLF